MPTASSVTTSPHLDEITELLDQGMSHRQVHATLAENHGPENVPSISALYRYARKREDATVGLGAILPNGAGPVNSVGLLNRLICVQERRIVRLWQLEQERPVPGIQLDIALRTMLAYVKERERLVQARGVRRGERRETEDAADLGFDPIRLEAALEVLREYNRNVAHQDPFGPAAAAPPDTRDEPPADVTSPAGEGESAQEDLGAEPAGGESIRPASAFHQDDRNRPIAAPVESARADAAAQSPTTIARPSMYPAFHDSPHPTLAPRQEDPCDDAQDPRPRS